MNFTEISNDGVCVYVRSSVQVSNVFRNLARICILSILFGLLLRTISDASSVWHWIGLALALGGSVILIPLGRTILWNLHGKEFLSFSPKSVKQELSYGFFGMPVRSYKYDSRVTFDFEVLRENNNISEGVIHLYGYDEDDQPCHLMRTSVYITESTYQEFLDNITSVFYVDSE